MKPKVQFLVSLSVLSPVHVRTHTHISFIMLHCEVNYVFLDLLIFVYVYKYLFTCMYVPVTCGGQKKVSDALELELWIIVSHHMDARN